MSTKTTLSQLSHLTIFQLKDITNNGGGGGSTNASDIFLSGIFVPANGIIEENDNVKIAIEKTQGQINSLIPTEKILTETDFTIQTINGTDYKICDTSSFITNANTIYIIEVQDVIGLPIVLLPDPTLIPSYTQIIMINRLQSLLRLSSNGFKIAGVLTDSTQEKFFTIDSIVVNGAEIITGGGVFCQFLRSIDGYITSSDKLFS
jgi:hypothetical protein